MKDAFDRDSLPTGRSFDRITSIVEQLRRGEAASSVASGRQQVRAELDSFAALVSNLSPGSAAGLSRAGMSGRNDEDLWARLAHSRGDLAQLETLVGKTFSGGSPHHLHVTDSPPASVSVEPVFIFHDKKVTSIHTETEDQRRRHHHHLTQSAKMVDLVENIDSCGVFSLIQPGPLFPNTEPDPCRN